jgi:F0F1-type ATP synthase membrane subunit c/vacuolar-type H+-ATPase subunit K
MTEADDPGWPSAVSVLLMLLPGAPIWLPRRRSAGDPLMSLRSTFLSFSLALVMFGVVLTFIGGLPNGPVVAWIPVLIVFAVASVVAVRLVTSRPFDCSSDAALAGSYRTRFFATIALTEAVALFGFVFTFIGGPAWTFDAGAVFAILRLWTTNAPTRSGLRRDQDALNAQGCGRSLVQAIRSTPPPPRARR